MNWEAIGALGEVFGAFAVIITLIYLSTQIRQNTKAIKLNTSHAVTGQLLHIYSQMSEHDKLAELLQLGSADPENITGSNKVRYYAMNTNFMRAVENAYIQWSEDALDSRHWTGMRRMAIDYAKVPGFQGFWRDRKHFFSEEFQEYMETDLMLDSSRPDVPLPGEFQ